MNTAAQPTDIDKRLEELVERSGLMKDPWVTGLADALLRARKNAEAITLRLDHVSGVARDLGHHQYDGCEWCVDSKPLVKRSWAALADPELEELLR